MPESFTYGIEEEFLLCSKTTLHISSKNRDRIVDLVNEQIGGRCSKEFFAYQIETVTDPCSDRWSLLRQLEENRRSLLEVSSRFDEFPIATGVLCERMPGWDEITNDKKYISIIERHPEYTMFGGGGISALHVHVGTPVEADRAHVINYVLPMMPIFIGLSANSPIFDGRAGPFLSMRRAVVNSIPRFGLMPAFRRYKDYDECQNGLLKLGVIERPGELWWMIRPSQRYPTIELRAPDTCVSPLMSAAIGALFRCSVVAACRNDNVQVLSILELNLLEERCRQAARYGLQARLPYATRPEPLDIKDLVRSCLAQLGPIAEEYGLDEDFSFIARTLIEDDAALKIREAWLGYQECRDEGRRRRYFDAITASVANA